MLAREEMGLSLPHDHQLVLVDVTQSTHAVMCKGVMLRWS